MRHYLLNFHYAHICGTDDLIHTDKLFDTVGTPADDSCNRKHCGIKLHGNSKHIINETAEEVHVRADTFENAAFICANACVTLSGALPFMFMLTKILNKPLGYLGAKMGINSISALAFLGSLVTNASTFGVMEKMDKKGVVLNSAFAVSASFVLGAHLAFTMAFDGEYILPMIVGKIVSGICAVLLAFVMYREKDTKNEQTTN